MEIQHTIERKLISNFTPDHLEVINESYKHSVPPGSESHFLVVVVSSAFNDKSLIQRHRMVNTCLAAELEGPVHALAIRALTPDEWLAKQGEVAGTPPCLGGGKAG